MRTRLKRVASLMLIVLMLFMVIPTGLASESDGTSEPVIPGLLDGGKLADSVLSLTGDSNEQLTVTFNIGAEAEAAGVTVPDSVTVAKGGKIDTLITPVWQNAEGEVVKVFDGWYMDGEFKNVFNKEDTINEDITLYAKWIGPAEDNKYYVNFYSQDGKTLHLTVAVDEGKCVTPADGPVMEGLVFKGWSTSLQNGASITDFVSFNFDEPVSSSTDLSKKTLNLYAWYGRAVNVSFISNGGSAVATQIIIEGECANKPDTTREGFEFAGWSTDPAEYKEFDFSAPVTSSLTLYAFWNAKLVPVNIVYMWENADDANYSPAGHSQTVYAPAGSYISIEKNDNITTTGAKHSVRYSNTSGGPFAGYAKVSPDGGNATIPDVYATHYQYSSATNNRYVFPNGTTVMHVYYDRVRVTLTFKYDAGGLFGGLGAGAIDVDKHVSAEDKQKYAVAYNSQNRSFTYSFTAKYGQNIVPVWPQISWVETNGNFYGWRKPNDVDQVSNVYTLVNDLFTAPYISEGKLVASGTLNAVGIDTSTYWLIYARTTLPGETADFSYNGKNYTIHSDACQMAKAGAYFGYKALEGCNAISGEVEFGKKYSSLGNSTSISVGTRYPKVVTAVDGTIKDKFNGVFGDKIGRDDKCQILLYDRQELTLNLFVYDDTYGSNPQSAKYLYGDWIYNEEGDLLKIVEGAMKKSNYRFAGWYTDKDYTPGTEFEVDKDTRIYGNLNLYAKWEPDQFIAEYYLYIDDTTPYATQGFAENGTIDDKFVPPAVQDLFIGWYWYQNGGLNPFDFTATVGQAHVDGDGVLKLYAKWKGSTGKVSYLPGDGGDNDTQEETDPKDFEINAASVQLPDYKKVWESGVPTDSSLKFVGWKAPNGAIYQPDKYVLVTRVLMRFEAQWSKDAVKLIYDANGGEGSNVTETWARGSEVSIWDNKDLNNPHFTREGYELTGWAKDEGATQPDYKLGEGTIELNADTILYAVWKRSAVDVTITKQVTGNMGNKTRRFAITVTSTQAMGSPSNGEYTLSADGLTAEFALADAESVTLRDVPIAAKLTVTEADAGDYEMTISPCDPNASEYTIPDDAQSPISITITNHLDAIPDTGILLDSLPYVLILVAVIAIGAVWIIRKRRNRDDF